MARWRQRLFGNAAAEGGRGVFVIPAGEPSRQYRDTGGRARRPGARKDPSDRPVRVFKQFLRDCPRRPGRRFAAGLHWDSSPRSALDLGCRWRRSRWKVANPSKAGGSRDFSDRLSEPDPKVAGRVRRGCVAGFPWLRRPGNAWFRDQFAAMDQDEILRRAGASDF